MSSAEVALDAGLAEHESVGLTSEDLHKIYYFMQLTRSVEDRVRRLYLQGRLQGAVYTSRGQEGTAVASAYALEPQDFVAPLIRDLGASFTRGLDPKIIFAQWLGKSTGITGGRDGNLHFGDLSKGVVAPISMLGATLPVCAGIALAGKQKNENRVALAYIGDGGTNTGDFHEGLNFAAALKLPLIVLVEDNGFAYSTPTSKHVALKTLADRAAGYAVPGVTIDGNNVMAVYGATKEAASRCRRGEGPSLIEVKTFRMRGHAEHDDAFYVPKELLAEWEQKDPIERLAVYLANGGLITQAEKQELEARIDREVDDALAWAEESPGPDPDTQTQDVYASPV